MHAKCCEIIFNFFHLFLKHFNNTWDWNKHFNWKKRPTTTAQCKKKQQQPHWNGNVNALRTRKWIYFQNKNVSLLLLVLLVVLLSLWYLRNWSIEISETSDLRSFSGNFKHCVFININQNANMAIECGAAKVIYWFYIFNSQSECT